MDKPCLVIMAAGMGSRYGGLKQLDTVDKSGHIIMDFSLYDAHQAGFERVVFIIKPSIEKQFKETVGARAEKYMQVDYAYQVPEDLPDGYTVPEGREKPWGTAHALLAARHLINGPFAVINADDYYGKKAFKDQYDFLCGLTEADKYSFCMSGYYLINTLTDNGYVSRGVCETDERGHLTSITERTRIEKRDGHPAFTLDNGATWTALPDDTPVSMNLWGFSRAYLDAAWEGFPAFLDKALAENPLKAEYYVPSVVNSLLEKGATVKVVPTPDTWYGVTYSEDKATVVEAIARMEAAGLYPEEF
ncbi:MAG: nucleotidyltransferase [Lachnospiraceae bacterium]|nr:nucleotidyltransferase [Lachnospiraceae bacterium]